MERVKFYSNIDMTTEYNFNKAIDVIKNIKNINYNINDILEFYNILKLFNEEYLNNKKEDVKHLCNKSKSQINNIIGKFCSNISEANIESYLDKIDFEYVEDFFELIDKYKVYKNINANKFKDILEKNDSYLYMVLHNKNLVNEYKNLLREELLSNNNSVEFLLDEYEIKHLSNHKPLIFPRTLTIEDKEKMFTNYINSEFANLNYLRIIKNLQSTNELNISDKTKLLAKKRIEEQEKELFSENSGMETTMLVQFKKNLEKIVEFSFEDQNWSFSYDINWIEKNIDDYSTLLNNFIYMFEYVDAQMRWTMVSKLSYMGVIERSIFLRSKRDYPIGMVFNRLDNLADLQMIGYYNQLQKYNVRVEDLIDWFFSTYIIKEFGISNFNINIPSKNSNYLEKCRTLLPEIDSCLKQFNYYVEDGIIVPELLQISSTHIFFKNVKSLLKNKYAYSNGDDYNIIAFYFFSDQCMLGYIERIKKKYKNFYEVLMNEKIKKEDIVNYEWSSLQKLIDDGYIYVDSENYLNITNKMQMAVLYDLYLNDVISYWKLNTRQKKEVNILVKKELLRFESTLFSKPEQDYLNFYLNKSEFTNSLDLRNMYSHGTQPSRDENIHYSNYIKFLKIFILIIIKINDELCIKDEILNNK